MSTPDFDDEYHALSVLKTNFREWRNGCLCPRQDDYEPNGTEIDAINYLIQEWDFAYDPLSHPPVRR
jgi:hypothetical protein